MREDEQGEGSHELLRASGQHLGHGLKWTLSVLLFMLIGAWVDSKMGTSPFVMIPVSYTHLTLPTILLV